MITITPVKQGFLNGQRGRIYADKGYMSSEQRFKLMEQNVDFLACPKENQTFASEEGLKLRMLWDRVHKKAYRQCQKIERVFAKLKLKRSSRRNGVPAAGVLRTSFFN